MIDSLLSSSVKDKAFFFLATTSWSKASERRLGDYLVHRNVWRHGLGCFIALL